MAIEQADVRKGRKLSGIWAIPLLALALGLYMVVHNWMTRGPEIEIAFSDASGLEQGKTKIKFRNVDMGVVQSVRLNDSFDGVIATAKLERQALPLLVDDTRFWVVTARVGADQISGLDTLLSGAYIQLAPGASEKPRREFVALAEPPLTPAGAPGLRLRLSSSRASSVSPGDSILYSGFKVGRVEAMRFDPVDRMVRYEIFIDAPYHDLVHGNVRFWDVSGVSVNVDADGFRLEIGSLDTLLLGGVAFGLPEGAVPGDTVADEAEFRLYASQSEMQENPYSVGTRYVVSFDQSIKGLLPGAPVEFRGIRIGKVERIMLKEALAMYQAQGKLGEGVPFPVLIYLEPGRMALPDTEAAIATMRESIEVGVGNGMRASLESGSILTGAKYVSIDFFPDASEAALGTFLDYTTIPTVETGLSQLEYKVNAILDKVNALPLADTVSSVNSAIDTLNRNLQNLESILENQSTQALPTHLDETLQALRDAVGNLSQDSENARNLNSSLLQLNRTLGNLESLTRKLSSQPSAVILPSKPVPDPIPEVSTP